MKYTESDLVLRLETSIPAYYVSLNGQTKFYTLASMFLEAAAEHASRRGFGYYDMIRKKVYWVLSRFHVIMHHYPRMTEPVIVETWPKGINRLFFLRDYRMFSEDRRLLASATTAWLILDGNTGRPYKTDPGSKLFDYRAKDRHAIENMPGKLPGVPSPDRQVSRIAGYSDLGIYQHVNAIKYIEWIQDCYDVELYQSQNVSEFQINYQLETRYGENINIKIRNHSEDDPFDNFEGIRASDQNRAFTARIRFGNFEGS